MIKEKIIQLQNRKEIPKYKKLYKKDNESNLINTKKEKLYDYYKCDYCNNEIRLDVKQHKRNGGIVCIPHSLTKRGKVDLVLCNKCLNKTLKEFKE